LNARLDCRRASDGVIPRAFSWSPIGPDGAGHPSARSGITQPDRIRGVDTLSDGRRVSDRGTTCTASATRSCSGYSRAASRRRPFDTRTPSPDRTCAGGQVGPSHPERREPRRAACPPDGRASTTHRRGSAGLPRSSRGGPPRSPLRPRDLHGDAPATRAPLAGRRPRRGSGDDPPYAAARHARARRAEDAASPANAPARCGYGARAPRASAPTAGGTAGGGPSVGGRRLRLLDRHRNPLDSRNVTKAFQRILATAGLPHQRFHDLRHACATLLLEDGEDLGVVSRTSATRRSLRRPTFTPI